MKIAIVRGRNLNPFEMQNYRPLAERHEVMAYAAHSTSFSAEEIGLPMKKLPTFEEFYSFLPSPLRGLTYGLSLRFGMNEHLFGLEKALIDDDIIHTAETYTGYSYQAARIKSGKTRLIVTVWENIPLQSIHQFNGFDNIPFLRNGPRRVLTGNDKYVSYVMEKTDIFIAITEHARSALRIEGVNDDKIRVVPMGVDTSRFHPYADIEFREKLGLSTEDFAVLFIGRLVREKGIYDLLYAARLLSLDKELDHIKFVIAGQGPELEPIQRLIEAMHLKQYFKLVGSYPYSTIPRLYNSADAFILPSIPVSWWQEQFGMVLVEAMASGLPVISTLSGSIPEVVGDAGLLIQPNDPLSICQAIKKLAGDSAEHAKYSRKGRERALKMFNTAIVSKKIESVYMEII